MFARLMAWWNRKQFYTFQKDEIFIPKQLPCASPSSIDEDDDEWNNESESSDGLDLDQEAISGPRMLGAGSSAIDLEDEVAVTTKTGGAPARMEDTAFPLRLGSKPKLTLSDLSSQPLAPTCQPSPTGTTAGSLRDLAFSSSLAGSLESMDSLVESHWDPDDDASNVTPLVTNIPQPAMDAFFVEHVRFLQVQTQPREVQEVYRS